VPTALAACDTLRGKKKWMLGKKKDVCKSTNQAETTHPQLCPRAMLCAETRWMREKKYV